MPLKFYTDMRVIGGLTGEDLSGAQNADWVTSAAGGRGAVREVCDALLKASQDKDFNTIVRERLKRPIIKVNSAELADYMTNLYKQLEEMAK